MRCRLNALWEYSVEEFKNDSRIEMLYKSLPESSASYYYIDRILMWMCLYIEDIKTLLEWCLVNLSLIGNRKIWAKWRYLAGKLKNKCGISLCIGIISISFHLKRKWRIWIFPFFLNFSLTQLQPDNFLVYSFLNQHLSWLKLKILLSWDVTIKQHTKFNNIFNLIKNHHLWV